jgi:hypothetical protein
MKTVTPSDLLARATKASVDLVNRLREFNRQHDADVPPHLDLWQLGGRLQDSVLAFLARREAMEAPLEMQGEPRTESRGAASKY